jgi:hypothetical protein
VRRVLGYKSVVKTPDHQNSRLPGSVLGGGGESGELGERSIHLKPLSSSSGLGFETGGTEVKKQYADAMAGTSRVHEEQLPPKEDAVDQRHHDLEGLMDKFKEWAMEVYRGKETTAIEEGEELAVVEKLGDYCFKL